MGVGDGGGAGDIANNAQNVNVLLGKLLRIDPEERRLPDRCAARLCDPAEQSFRIRWRPSRNLGLRPAQSLPRKLRSADPKSVGRRRRPECARRDRSYAPDRRRRQFRLARTRRDGLLHWAGPAWLDPARRRISPRLRAARGQFGHRRLRLSRPGRGASRPICVRRLRRGQPLVDCGRASKHRLRPSPAAPSSCAMRASPPMPERSTTSQASEPTSPAISTSSISTARFSGSRLPSS